ncbi:MAG: DEAD/DEAH box helicase [Acidobacteria bacterium 13_1_20CM_2_65_9]|nr:MAG: DEAD/DEAH box helicase [Acidobacteria bacterium 13_1_20CM_2_65_9]
MSARSISDPLAPFHPAVRAWFAAAFDAPTRPQALGWPAIAQGDSTLILSPTGSGKTLTAFLSCLDRLMFSPAPPRSKRCRVLYVSPLKALAVDVERNLRAPLAGIAQLAEHSGTPYVTPFIAIRTGDTPQSERARFQREPADILITTPESLYLLLTSNAREALRSVDTVIIDEIHALVPTKRGAHLALSLERLEALCDKPPQRIGLSATQRPLDEVARFLGGTEQGSRRGGAASPPRPKRADTRVGPYDEKRVDVEIEHEFSTHRTVHYRPVTIVDAGHKKELKLTIEVPVEDMAKLTSSYASGAPPPLATALRRISSEVAAGADSLSSRGPQAPADDIPSGPAAFSKTWPQAPGDTRPSIWAAIHPRLLDLIRAHRSTLIFVNSRRLAERLAGALNELAGETLVRSHHGSIARPQRVEIEDLLKAGALRALVATSSLELGIDMGAIDLVVQIEAPPSVASGLQRIGRGGHQANAISEGVIFPKFRGDLVACAAVAKAMHEGAVEATRYPRNPLDIVAQQIVAMVSMDTWNVDELFATIRRAAPFAELSRMVFEGVLDMLSGRYPSDEFAELRPRVTWDRVAGTITAREGAKRVAIANGGTIPDRGLYGVFLLGAGAGAARVGELDEEMVFESRVGETFVLGASSWRIEEITHDRVLVTPAPGEPGKMPFWKGDRAGRPLELGLAIGKLMHDLMRVPPAAAVERLTREHDLDARAAENLLQYLRDQVAVTRALPDASTVVVERLRDELGDWRVCVLSPRGGRVHAPWAMAVAAKIREETGTDVETLWGDDGFVVRFPDVDEPPDPRLLMPDPDEVQALVVRQLGATALFAAKFRENAARSLLLPKRRPGMRAPLWQQRKRAADLLAVASRYGSFPVLLETYRECLRDFFDMPALVSTLGDLRSRKIRLATVDSETPSPFAASLLFSYVASFIYEGDAPLAERRAQALAVDQSQLRELLGDAELRELLDADAMDAIERQLQRLDPHYQAKSADGVHDMLLGLGDLTALEIGARAISVDVARSVDDLVKARRVLPVRIAGDPRYIAVEDAARYRDALGVPLPVGIPESLLQPVRDPLGDLALRYARTHAPFPAADFGARYGLGIAAADAVLTRLSAEGRLVEGEFRPGGTRREWTDAGVLRMLRRRSLAKLRQEIEPVDQSILGRFETTWQGIVQRRHGADALLDAIEQLQGAPLPASILETEILPARIDVYDPADLDAVTAAGEVVWVGVEPLGDRDGRVALYLADHLPRLLPPQVRLPVPSVSEGKPDLSERERAILDCLRSRGASFFGPLHDAVGGGYPGETVNALWNLVWQGLVTNDTFHALRAFTRSRAPRRKARRTTEAAAFRSRRLAPPSAEGRWALVHADVARPLHLSQGRGEGGSERPALRTKASDATKWAAAVTQQLLARHGVVTREAVTTENVPGGFVVVYPVLKGMEETGRIRRGYFVAGLGATQFAMPGALDLLRSLRDAPDDVEVVVLAATDPANPYGATLKWPAFAASAASAGQASLPHRAAASAAQAFVSDSGGQSRAEAALAAKAGRGPTRSVGATVILVNGALAAYLARGDRLLITFLPDAEPDRTKVGRAISRALIERARSGIESPRGMLIEEIDGGPPATHPLSPYLAEAGFIAGALGYQARLAR